MGCEKWPFASANTTIKALARNEKPLYRAKLCVFFVHASCFYVLFCSQMGTKDTKKQIIARNMTKIEHSSVSGHVIFVICSRNYSLFLSFVRTIVLSCELVRA